MAVYPRTALLLAERCLEAESYSLQKFAAACLAEGLVRESEIHPHEEKLFLNMNTPQDLLAVRNGGSL